MLISLFLTACNVSKATPTVEKDKMSGADFSWADLRWKRLSETDLSEANLSLVLLL